MMINQTKICLCARARLCMYYTLCVFVHFGPIVNQFTEFRGLALAIQLEGELTQYLNVAIGHLGDKRIKSKGSGEENVLGS